MISIDIKESTLKRLEEVATGFDNPDSVINRLLDRVGSKADKKPVLKFFPNDEKSFLKLLVRDKCAEVVLYYSDGERKIVHWKANNMTEKSSLRGNLWSGFLRGWRDKGIVSAEFSIYPREEDGYALIDIQRDSYLAYKLSLTFREARKLDGFYEMVRHVDGSTDCPLRHSIQFLEGYDLKIVSKIEGLDKNGNLWIPILVPGFYNDDCLDEVCHRTNVLKVE